MSETTYILIDTETGERETLEVVTVRTVEELRALFASLDAEGETSDEEDA